MSTSFSIKKLLSLDNSFDFVIENLSINLETPNSKTILKSILKVIPKVDRFQNEDGLENWKLEFSLTDDEGIEFLIVHDVLDIIVLLIEDDDEYYEDDIVDLIGIDDIYFAKYQEFLRNDNYKRILLKELRFWETDSNFHVYAIDHVEKILEKGYDLAPFGGKKDIEVEFSFDEEELFIGCIDEEYEALSANPDYNLPHDQFDPEHPEDSIELGIQSWSEFALEDDSWEDNLEEDWPEEEEEFDGDWDNESEDEWDPGFDNEDEKT